MFYDIIDPVDWPNGLFLSRIEISYEHKRTAVQPTKCEPRLEPNIQHVFPTSEKSQPFGL